MDPFRGCVDCGSRVNTVSSNTLIARCQKHIKDPEGIDLMGIKLTGVPPYASRYEVAETLRKFGEINYLMMYPETETAYTIFRKSACGTRLLMRKPFWICRREVATDYWKPEICGSPTYSSVIHQEVLGSVIAACYSGIHDIEHHIELVLEQLPVEDTEIKEKIPLLVEDLRETLEAFLPGYCMLLHGSYVTGLALKGAYVDVSIQEQLHETAGMPDNSLEQLKNIFNTLRFLQEKFSTIQDHCGQLIHVPTNLAFLLNFHSAQMRESTELIRQVLRLDSRIKPLILFVKYWAKSLCLLGSSRYSSYAVTLLVIFYLQQLSEAMVPALRLVNEDTVAEMSQNITNKSSLNKLLKGFYRYYADMKYGKRVICPYLGSTVNREAFSDGPESCMPESLEPYEIMVRNGAKPLPLDHPIVLQDPCQLNVNVTDDVGLKNLVDFQKRCENCLEDMKRGNLVGIIRESTIFKSSKYCPKRVKLIFKAGKYLDAKYLLPDSSPSHNIPRCELLQHFIKSLYILIPEFLTRFVKLEVTVVQKNDGKPATKIAKTAEMQDTSNGRSAEKSEDEDKREIQCIWVCEGAAMAVSWQERLEVAEQLQLPLTMSLFEREATISNHLLGKPQRLREAKFRLLLSASLPLETVYLTFVNMSSSKEPFTTVANNLCTLVPLWLRIAFDTGVAQEYLVTLTEIEDVD